MLLNLVTQTVPNAIGAVAPLSWTHRFGWPAIRPVLLLFVLVVSLFWKITLTNQYTWMDHPDMVSQVLPWFQFQAREWHGGHVPLWDPHLRA
jgi:hypothetical protein